MHIALSLLAITAAVVAVTAIAEKIRFSAPLLLMLFGIGASFIPFIHEPTLTTDVVLVGFLPPLLYAAAIRTSVIDFRTNWRAIGYLSILLIVVTALGIGVLTWLLLPVPFALAFAFGAIVAPPDAVAATTIARRVGLPRRLVTILEGESLLNDATAITCVRVGLVSLAGAVTAVDVASGFAVALFGGVAAGVAVAWLATVVRKHTTQPVFDTAISFMVPWAAYLPAEKIVVNDFHGSGVIAVVVAGLILGHKSPVIQSGLSRLSERVNWSTIQFLLENTVFLLIGLQARQIIINMGTSELTGSQIALFCVAILLGVMVIRMLWVLAGRFSLLPRRTQTRAEQLPWSHTVVLGWAGLRGVVTLATALLIPRELQQRDVLVFGAMVVVAGTLLIQGLTLPYLVRALSLRGPDPRSDALQAATVLQTASNAALEHLDEITDDSDDPDVIQRVRDRIAARPEALWERLGSDAETPADEYRRLRLATINTERAEVLRVRSTATVDHDVIEEVLGSLDIEESMLTIATERAEQLSEAGPVEVPLVDEGPCDDLVSAPTDTQPLSQACEDCIREGTRTVHLRMCLICGNVGCCDSSVGHHATRHFRETGHLVMRSFEPGETWRWCYLHQRLG
ncbi:MAG TPA: Na+/H+ antiporter [Microlunatus sp.]|nr:Na+/H+ antiporter [Microlunatus sp.]